MVAVRVRRTGQGVELFGHDGTPISIRPTVARLLTALHADLGQLVSTDKLVMRIWGDAPPNDPTASLHTAVARLRRLLPEGSVHRLPTGYALRLADGLVDDVDFEPAGPSNARVERFVPAFTPSTPLVGRARLLMAALDGVAGGRGVIFHGDAGAGKSRLAEEVVLASAQDGRPATFLRCRSVGSDVPLGAFSPLLQGSLPAGGLPLVVAARISIAEQLDGRVLVLGIDDLHQIDPLSAVLTSQLVNAGLALVVGTHRNMGVVPPPVADLWHDGHCDHVHVGELDRDELATLAQMQRGAALDDDDMERLWRLTNGNPLFATTVLQHPDLQLEINDPTLEAVILGQLAGLSAELRDALAVVAIGEPLSIAMLEKIVDLDALIALERASLITIDRQGGRTDVRVRHPLYGEHVRAGTSRLLARGIRGQLADAMAAHGTDRRDDLLRLATWSLDGGRALDPTLAIGAAREALRHGDLHLARRSARTVWDARRDVDAALVLAEAALIDEPGQAAIDVVQAALDPSLTPSADERQRRRLLTIGARAASLKMGDAALAERLLADSLDDPVLVTIHAQLLAYQGRAAEAVAMLKPSHVVSREGDVYRAVALATALTQLGRADEALRLVDAAITALRPMGDRVGAMMHQITAARARPLMMLGRLTEAEQAMRAGLAGGKEANDTQAEALNAVALAGLLPFLGRPGEGQALARHALDLLSNSHHRALQRWAWMSAGYAAVTTGDVDRADEALRALVQLNVATMTDGVEPLIAAGAARLRFDRDRSADLLQRGAAMCAQRDLVFEEAASLHEIARSGRGSSPRLDELAARCGGLIETFALHSRAIGRADPAALAEVSVRFDQQGAVALAAEAVGRAAEAEAAAGHMAQARRHVDRFRELAGRCDRGVVAPPIVIAEPLTSREREIGEMAARGWTNAVIAERLHLSVRTVDNHLSRTFEKLAIDSRAALAPVFGVLRP